MKYILLIFLLIAIMGCTAQTGITDQTGSVSLEGTGWKLEKLGSKTALPERRVTLIFQADNRIGGEAGCNSYSATYRLSGADLTISELFSTLMACVEPQIMEQEQQYLAGLEQAASYKLEGNRLAILDAAGTTLLTFVVL